MTESLSKICSHMGEYLSRFFLIKKSLQEKGCTEEKQHEENYKSSWNELPKDILEKIVLKLSIDDFARASSVCHSWRAILTSQDIRISPQVPWLLLPDDPCRDHILMYDLSESRLYKFKRHELLRRAKCCGTSKGWLIMEVGPNYRPDMILWNPVSGEIMTLPPLAAIPCFKHCSVFKNGLISVIRRVEVVSLGSSQVMVAAIFGWEDEILAFCSPQDRTWTIYESRKDNSMYDDILFHKGILYALISEEDEEEERSNKNELIVTHDAIYLSNCEAMLAIIHATYPSPNHHDDTEFDFHPTYWHAKESAVCQYLAESTTGELLLIKRYTNCSGNYAEEDDEDDESTDEIGEFLMHSQTHDFSVWVVNTSDRLGKRFCTVTGLESLGNQALFVATNGSSSHVSEIHKNCIYFLADQLLICDTDVKFFSHDSGVFYLEQGKIKRSFPSIDLPSPSNLGWFMPKLNS